MIKRFLVFFILACYGTRIFAAPGDLDTATFNSGGTQPGTNTTIIFNPASESEAYNLALQTDGKIVVVGLADSGGGLNRFAIARFNRDGTLDTTTFNPGGIGGTVPGTAVTYIDNPDVVAQAWGVGIQANGKIVVSGSVQDVNTGLFKVGVARFNTDGTLDTTFNSGGTYPGTNSTYIDSGTNSSFGFDMALQTDGKIVVNATVTESGIDRIGIARFNADGTLDTSFNSSGSRAGTVSTYIRSPSTGCFPASLVIQLDGKIVSTGTLEGVSFGGTGPDQFAVVRFLSDGTLDATFNPTGSPAGTFSTTVNGVNNISIDENYRCALQPDGSIITTGQVIEGGVTNLAVVRYTTNGALDGSFNPNGTLPGTLSLAINNNPFGNAVALQNDGKIIISGTSFTTTGTENFILVRLKSNGSLDTTFGSGGIVTLAGMGGQTIPDGSGTIANLIIQTDGKIDLIGYVGAPFGSFGIARFLGDLSICSSRLIEKYGKILLQ